MFKTKFSGHNTIWRAQKIGHCSRMPPCIRDCCNTMPERMD